MKASDNQCPYCSRPMRVCRMCCDACDVAIEASFAHSRLADLPVEHQRFIEMFVLASGSLKEIAERARVSYPTVRSRLDKIIDALRARIAENQEVRGTVLDGAGGEDATAEQAARLIKAI